MRVLEWNDCLKLTVSRGCRAGMKRPQIFVRVINFKNAFFPVSSILKVAGMIMFVLLIADSNVCSYARRQ